MHLYIHRMYWHAQWAVSAAYIVTDWSQADQALNMIDRSSEGDRVRSWKDWYIQISLISDLEEIYSNAIMRPQKQKHSELFFFLRWTTCCSYCWNCVCLLSQLTFWWFLGCLATSPCYLCIESRCERCMARLGISDKGCEMHRSDFPWLAMKVAILLAASCCSRPFNFQGTFAVRFWKI